MSLKDLIVSKEKFTEEQILRIVTGRVGYVPDKGEILLTPETNEMTNRQRILLYLVALQGWPFVCVDPHPRTARPADLSEALGTPGGTVRPVLMQLSSENLVYNDDGEYSVPVVALTKVEKEIAADTGAPARPRRTSKKRRNGSRTKGTSQDSTEGSPEPVEGTPTNREETKKAPAKRTGNRDLEGIFRLLVGQGFFNEPKSLADLHAELVRKGQIVPQTSISGILLKAVRDNTLTRDHAVANGKEVWVYTVASKGPS